MDLVLSLIIQKKQEITEEIENYSTNNSWLDTMNVDLFRQFNHSDTTEKIEKITEKNEIKLNNLEICYADGQYYAVDYAGNYPLYDNSKVEIPGYILTVHIRNKTQIDNAINSRYSENLINFDEIFDRGIDIDSSHLSTEKPTDAVNSTSNDLQYYIDLPTMVLEDDSHLQAVRDDSNTFNYQLTRREKKLDEGNILAELGIYRTSHDFSSYIKSEVNEPFHDSAPIDIVDEIYTDNRRTGFNSDYYYNKIPEKHDQINFIKKEKNLLDKFTFFKKIFIG